MAESLMRQPPPQTEAIADSEASSADILPSWKEATLRDKLRIATYSALIYAPVSILLVVIAALGPLYFALFFWPMTIGDSDRPELYYWHNSSEHRRARIVGSICMGIETLFVLLFVCSFWKAFSTSPGSVPSSPEWRDLQIAEQHRLHMFSEKKHTNGAIRWCRRCSLVKPDRSHHCRLCDQCVLKMDHHCPWIANCVGFYNYKFFFLMLTYGMLGLWMFEGTFWETLVITWRDDETSTEFSFFVTVVYSLMFILMVAVTLFWSFHLHLMATAVTTIEYCEKHRKNPSAKKSPYFRSTYESFQCALGKDPWLWPFPFVYRTNEETGLYFTIVRSAHHSSAESEKEPLVS